MRGRIGYRQTCAGVLAVVVATLAVAACGSSSSTASHSSTSSASSAGGSAATTSTAKSVRIGVLLATQTGYEAGYLKGIHQVVAQDGHTTLKVVNANFDPNQQLQQCQDLISAREVDELIIEPVEGSAVVPCVAAAKAAGIGTFSIDTPIGPSYASTSIQVPGITGQVIQPITQDAQAAVGMVVRACGTKNPCNVAAVVGQPSYTYSANKIKYEKQYLAKYPNIKLLTTVVGGLSNPSMGYSVGQDLMNKYPNLDVILGDDDITLTGVARAVAGAGRQGKIALIGDAASQEGVQAIKDGEFYGSVIYLPQTAAAKVTQMAIDAGRGEKLAEDNLTVSQINPLGTLELTKANVNKFTPQWAASS